MVHYQMRPKVLCVSGKSGAAGGINVRPKEPSAPNQLESAGILAGRLAIGQESHALLSYKGKI